MSKRLIARSKLSNRQLRQLIDFFALEVPALKAARVIGIHRHSAERVYQVIRQHVAWESVRAYPPYGATLKPTSPTLAGTGRGSGAVVPRAKWPSLGS